MKCEKAMLEDQIFLALDTQTSEPVGFICGTCAPSGMLLPTYMFVKPAYRKKGIGTHLLQTFREDFPDYTHELIYFNKALAPMYEKLGYYIAEDERIAIRWK